MFSSNTTQVSDGGYQISRSLRFNSADSAYLNRTPASAGNRRTWTWSAWVKLSAFTAARRLFSARVGLTGDQTFIQASATDTLLIGGNSSAYELRTTAVYRDPSAWYHIVLAFDTTQATSSNRIKLYVNGSQVTALQTATYPSQNLDTFVNATNPHSLGAESGTPSEFLNGYMTETYLIDGQQLDATSFGETNAQTGVWQPKAYSGSYGTNGFYLNFSDNSNTTAATLGKDYSGNGNNWTPNNFSVTAGAGNDSLVDSPTSYGVDTGVGGTVRGNYCTLNPLTTTAGTYTQGNLRYTGPTSWRRSNATISRATGQWYWEVTLGNAPFPVRLSGEWNAFGFGLATTFNSTNTPPLQTDAVILADNGYYKNFSGSWTDGGSAFSSGDVLSIAVDLDANTFTFRRNNTSVATGTIGGTVGRELVPIIISYDGQYGVMDCNFGQRPFAYTAPSGFKALCTQNLPTPTIGATTATQAGKYFGATPYSGTSATQAIVNDGFQPDLIWLKARNAVGDNGLYDSIRGISLRLVANNTNAEASVPLDSFNSNGFSTTSNYNNSGQTLVAWQWRGGGTGVTNTAGSITSTVSANTTSGFSIITWTGNATQGATIGHGLGAVPALFIIKNRSVSGSNWPVKTNQLSTNSYLYLNSSNAAASFSFFWPNDPTSSIIYLGSNSDVNGSGNSMVCYAFAEVAGYSKFGSYTGNGSADGPFVFTGFRPAFVLTKRTDSASDWQLMDSSRDTYNVANKALFPNLSDAETTGYNKDFLSNGFKIRDNGSSLNASGGTFIYMAFASAPLKFSLAR
jgi:hypothetical protein